MADPTPRLQGEGDQAFLLQLADAIRPLGNPVHVAALATRLLGEYLGADRVVYGEIDGEWVSVRACYAAGLPPMPERVAIDAFGDAILDICRRDRTVVVDDLERDVRFAADRDAYRQAGIRALAGLMVQHDDRWVVKFGVHCAQPRRWTAAEIRLIAEVAERTWTASQRARAELALRESERRYRTLFDSMDEGFCVTELVRDVDGRAVDYRVVLCNPALERLSGLRPDEILGRPGSEVSPTDYLRWLALYARVVESRTVLRFEEGIEALGRLWYVIAFPYGGDSAAILFDDITDRKKAEAALRDSEEKLRALFDGSDEGFCVIELVRDRGGRIVDMVVREVNRAFERQTGLRGAAGQTVRTLLPASERLWGELFSRVLETGAPIRAEHHAPDLDRWYTAFFLRIGGRGSRQVAVVLNDITERKRAEAALREREARQAFLLRFSDALRPLGAASAIEAEATRLLREHFEAGWCCYTICEADGAVVTVRHEATREGLPSLVGEHRFAARPPFVDHYCAGLVLNVPDLASSPLVDARTAAHYAAFGIHALLGVPLVKGGTLQATLMVADTRARPWTPEAVDVLRDCAERTWAAIERGLAEEALRRANDRLEARVRDRTAQIEALFRRLVTVQEEERRRIAREIHDQLGQQMTALRMHVAALRERAAADATLLSQVAGAEVLAAELDETIDGLTWDLRPATLDHLGLPAALQQLVDRWSARAGVPAEFQPTGVDGLRLAPDVEANLYRLVQEALHNVVKHAGATRVSVLLSRRGGELRLVIEDDGRGFTVTGDALPPRHDRMGLLGMRERATLAGGGLEIESAPGRGTTVFVRVPIDAAGLS